MSADPGMSQRLPASIVDVLDRRATEQPDRRAYVFLSDRGTEVDALTYADLHRRASAVAACVRARAPAGERAILMFQPGLDFIAGLFGCFMAGVIAVPMMIPRRSTSHDASAEIVADCAPRVVLANAELADVRPDLVERFRHAGIEWIAVPRGLAEPGHSNSRPHVGSHDIAFLQYTSGSTSLPRGVMVAHRNLIENLEMIRITFGNTPDSTCVSWAPLYHDMGLIVNVLQSIYVGALCVLMAPVTFLQRPVTWLRAICDYRAEIAGGPNFAYDLCVDRVRAEQMAGIDLSCWKLAFNGAEPIRQETIERFIGTFSGYSFGAEAMYPGYGLAEATLLVSAGKRGAGAVSRLVSRHALQQHQCTAPTDDADRQAIVSSGRAIAGERIAIVDPDESQRLQPDRIGEVWVQGPHVAQGYWGNAEATTAIFQARIAGESEESWLRTGDLGFLDGSGELYITGRIKDVIIIRGINHYPQDIEKTVQDTHPGLRRNCGAAFSWLDQQGLERLIIVQEVERTYRHRVASEDMVGRTREAVTAEHGIAPHAIVLIRPGAIPKTTSGKIQRRLTRQLWLEGGLQVLE